MGNLFLKIDDDLSESEKLWRYMDLSKFISLIEKNTLWLARSDKFRDKHEGRFPDEIRKIIEKAYESFEDDDDSIVKDTDDFQDYLRKKTFISCWHKNFDENMVMWEIYGRDTNALAIQVTVGKIRDSVDPSELSGHSLLLKNVSYQRADEIPGTPLYEECFFIKRPHFAFEQEVRISLDTYSRITPTKRTPHGYYLPISINNFIDKILIHPDSSDWFMDVINSIAKKYNVQAEVERGQYGTE